MDLDYDIMMVALSKRDKREIYKFNMRMWVHAWDMQTCGCMHEACSMHQTCMHAPNMHACTKHADMHQTCGHAPNMHACTKHADMRLTIENMHEWTKTSSLHKLIVAYQLKGKKKILAVDS